MDKITKEEIGTLIKQQRNRLKITQEELSERTGIHEKQISRIEAGKNYPTLANFFLILKALDMRFADFDKDEDSLNCQDIDNLIAESTPGERKLYLEVIKTIKKNG